MNEKNKILIKVKSACRITQLKKTNLANKHMIFTKLILSRNKCKQKTGKSQIKGYNGRKITKKKAII